MNLLNSNVFKLVHPLNALLPIVLMPIVPLTATDAKLVQPLKALLPNFVKVDGRVRLVKEAQLSNAPPTLSSSLMVTVAGAAGQIILVMGVLAKARLEIVTLPVTALKSTVCKLAQESKADSPITKLATSEAMNF